MTRGRLEEEEGITYYIRYCPEDDSYLQARTVTGRATWLTTRATWRQMSARRRWRSGREPTGPHAIWPQ